MMEDVGDYFFDDRASNDSSTTSNTMVLYYGSSDRDGHGEYLPHDILSAAGVQETTRHGGFSPVNSKDSFSSDDDNENLEESKFSQKDYHDAFDRPMPNTRRVWRCHIGDICENYFVMTGKLVPSERKLGSVQLPGELAASVYQMHVPNSERTKEIVDMLFAGSPKKYIRGSFFKMQEDKWTIFWHPTRLTDLTTSEIQSVICAALNSRRRLLFVIGVASNSKIIGCVLSDVECGIIRQQFEECTSSGFIPSLDEGIVRLCFHQVYDEAGNQIPSLYLAEISINDKVDTLYQLSSGRIFYVNRGSVVQRLSFNDAYNMLLRRKTEINRVSKNQPNKMRIIPCLRESGTVDSSLLKRVFLFGFPGFVIGLLAYDYLPKMLRK